MPDEPSQLDRFKQAARYLECDDDEECFAERVKRIAAHRPAKDKPERETPE